LVVVVQWPADPKIGWKPDLVKPNSSSLSPG
jgi:hypothetical protein